MNDAVPDLQWMPPEMRDRFQQMRDRGGFQSSTAFLSFLLGKHAEKNGEPDSTQSPIQPTELSHVGTTEYHQATTTNSDLPSTIEGEVEVGSSGEVIVRMNNRLESQVVPSEATKLQAADPVGVYPSNRITTVIIGDREEQDGVLVKRSGSSFPTMVLVRDGSGPDQLVSMANMEGVTQPRGQATSHNSRVTSFSGSVEQSLGGGTLPPMSIFNQAAPITRTVTSVVPAYGSTEHTPTQNQVVAMTSFGVDGNNSSHGIDLLARAAADIGIMRLDPISGHFVSNSEVEEQNVEAETWRDIVDTIAPEIEGDSRHDCKRTTAKRSAAKSSLPATLTVTPKQPHVCDICGRSFRMQRSFTMHRKSHKSQILQCKVCKFTTSNSVEMSLHEQVAHPPNSKKSFKKATDVRATTTVGPKLPPSSASLDTAAMMQLIQKLQEEVGTLKAHTNVRQTRSRATPNPVASIEEEVKKLQELVVKAQASEVTNGDGETPAVETVVPVHVKREDSSVEGDATHLVPKIEDDKEEEDEDVNPAMEVDVAAEPQHSPPLEEEHSHRPRRAASKAVSAQRKPRGQKQRLNKLKCGICLITFPTTTTLEAHIATHTSVHGSQHECRLCHRRFKSHQKLIQHVVCHDDGAPTPHTCDHCGQVFQYRYRLTMHLKNKHPSHLTSDLEDKLMGKPGPTHKCPHCTMIYPREDKLEEHIGAMHNEDGAVKPKYVCEICGAAYHIKGSYRTHLKRHVGGDVQCPHCDYKSKYGGTLKEHIRLVHLNEHKYVCEECGRPFKRKRNMDEHRWSAHFNLRAFACPFPECGKTFGAKRHLVVHERIHTGEKPLQCQFCDYTCRQKNSMNWHLRKHQDVVTPPTPVPGKGRPKLSKAETTGKKGTKKKTSQTPTTSAPMVLDPYSGDTTMGPPVLSKPGEGVPYIQIAPKMDSTYQVHVENYGESGTTAMTASVSGTYGDQPQTITVDQPQTITVSPDGIVQVVGLPMAQQNSIPVYYAQELSAPSNQPLVPQYYQEQQ